MRRTWTACLLLAAAALAGCGGSGGSGGGKTATVKAGQPVRFTAREYKFDPGNLTVNAGGKPATVPITLHNSGALAHDLKVERGGQEIGGTGVITADKDSSATLRLAPGSYTFFCSIGDHAQLGMKGTLRVR
jgi:plastocyanin